jgi:hypothetical protein
MRPLMLWNAYFVLRLPRIRNISGVQGGSKLVESKCFHRHTGYGTSKKFRFKYSMPLSQSVSLANMFSN